MFVCGTWEPGVDGVGDYTYRLAINLCKIGVSCNIVAINDYRVKALKKVSRHVSEKTNLTVLRIPASCSAMEKARLLGSEVSLRRPDWISLQYVPYSFNRKGLIWKMFLWLSHIRSGAKWHMMTHELWIDPNEKLSNRVIAPLQRLLLRGLIFYLRPMVVHTSNEYYVEKLRSINVNASRLPLFSNIAVHHNTHFDAKSESGIRFVVFGSIHAEWKPSRLIDELEGFADASGIKPITVISIGNAGSHGVKLWQKLAATTPDWLEFKQMGSLTAAEISLELQRADFGITTTPSHLLGKSGSVAAMLAHKLIVIVPRIERCYGLWHQEFLRDRRFIPLDKQFRQRLLSARNEVCGRQENNIVDNEQLNKVSEVLLRSLGGIE